MRRNMASRTVRYYNVGVKSKNSTEDYIRLGDKAFALPPIGEYIDVPVRLEKALKRRYGNGFSRSPRIANQMKVQNAPEALSNEQLLKEIERLQRIAAERFQGGESKSIDETIPGPVPSEDVLAELEAQEDPIAQPAEEVVEFTEDAAPVNKGRGKGGNK